MGILFFILVVCGLILWLCWYIANQFYNVAKMKGHSERRYFWIPFWFSIWGYLLVIALPDRGNEVSAVSDELPEL